MNIAPSSSYPSPPLPPPFFPDPVHSSSSNPNLKNIGSSSDQQSGAYSQATFNGPYMGVVLVVLVVTFFLMAAFSVYVRRYAFLLGADAGTGRDIRSVQGRGLDRAAIDGLPMVVYHCTKEGSNGGGGGAAAAQEHEWSRRPDCVVCLADFQEAEKLRLLPKCEHCFHPECIDMWLFSHSTCPLCRRSLLPLALPPSNDVCISVQAHVPPPPPPPPSVQAPPPPPPPPSVQAPPPPPLPPVAAPP